MKEMSNSTLALLVVATIVISVFGTLMSLTKLDQLGVIGFVTEARGKANLTVPETTSFLLIDDLIDLHVMPINVTNTSEGVDDWWVVVNDGSVNISIWLYSPSNQNQNGNGTPLANTSGRGPFNSTKTDDGCLLSTYPSYPCFQVKCKNTTGSASAQCNDTYYSLPVYEDSTTVMAIYDMDWTTGADEAHFGVNVTVPIDEPSGYKEQAVVFYALKTT